jgi:hypothetical protein
MKERAKGNPFPGTSHKELRTFVRLTFKESALEGLEVVGRSVEERE